MMDGVPPPAGSGTRPTAWSGSAQFFRRDQGRSRCMGGDATVKLRDPWGTAGRWKFKAAVSTVRGTRLPNLAKTVLLHGSDAIDDGGAGRRVCNVRLPVVLQPSPWPCRRPCESPFEESRERNPCCRGPVRSGEARMPRVSRAPCDADFTDPSTRTGTALRRAAQVGRCRSWCRPFARRRTSLRSPSGCTPLLPAAASPGS